MTERLHDIRQRAQDALDRTRDTEVDLVLRENSEALGEAPPEWHAPEPVRERARRVHYKQQENLNAIMDAATQARWNAWADARVQRRVSRGMNDLAKIVGEGVAHFTKELRAEIAELRAEVVRLRGVVDGEVAELKAKRHG